MCKIECKINRTNCPYLFVFPDVKHNNEKAHLKTEFKHPFSDPVYIQLIPISGKTLKRPENCTVNVKKTYMKTQQIRKEKEKVRDNRKLISRWEQSSTKSFDNENCRNSKASSLSYSIHPGSSLIGCRGSEYLDVCLMCVCAHVVIVIIRLLRAVVVPQVMSDHIIRGR